MTVTNTAAFAQSTSPVPSADKPLGHGPNAVRRPFRWPDLLTDNGRGIAYGGDYNPDQWPEDVWDDDVRLMIKAGVNTVALAIFSWDRIQPTEDTWDFAWLDRIIDKLGRAGIAVDLASATAAAPLWLYEKHPEVLPIERNGDVVNAGSRQSWRPTSPVFREYALDLCRRLAEHYKDNPYVTAWHMNNEYGWNNRHDYSDDSLREFRRWCERRYGTIDALNEAWGTAFWSQHVNSFDEVLLPRHMGGDSMVNPGQMLDYERFGSDCLKEFYKAERDAIEAICPGKPFTTNFMVSTDQCTMDYADWSDDVDFVSNDHYFTAGRDHLDELACSDSLVSGFARRRPWYLMEHSTSAVQWKPLNSRKRHGQLVRDALAHVALGSDAICFFQWRQSRSGAECFHSAMLPHAGEDSAVYREVCELGGMLRTLSDAGVQGSEVRRSRTAILFDADCEWMTRCETLPSMKLNHWHDVRDWYYAFLDAGMRADVVPLRADWSEYDTIVMPTMINLSEFACDRVRGYVRGGGRVVIGYATGLMDETFHTALGGYPGMLRDVAGVRAEEFNILGPVDGDPDTVGLSNGAIARLWANAVTSVADSATVLAAYEGEEAEEWELDGVPALVRNAYGDGEAYYVGCDLDREALGDFVRGYLAGEGAAGAGAIAGDDSEDGVGVSSAAGSGASTGVVSDGVIAVDVAILHTVRETADTRFDFYLPRGKEDVTLESVPGDVIIAHRCEPNANGGYTLHRNAVLITRTTK